MDKSKFMRAIDVLHDPIALFSNALDNWDPSLEEIWSNDRIFVVVGSGLLLCTNAKATVPTIHSGSIERKIWNQLQDALNGLNLTDEQVVSISILARFTVSSWKLTNPEVVRDKALAVWGDEDEAHAAIERMVDRAFS